MEVLSLLFSIAALVIAMLAYARTGGVSDLKHQVTNMGSSIDTLRHRTADVIDKVERLVRGSEKSDGPDQPGGPNT